MNVFNLFLVWIFGFFVLLSFDLFTEAFIFEWLEWNGTNKNDWFFALWWGLVVVWALYGSLKIFLKWKDSHVLTNMQNEVYKVLYEGNTVYDAFKGLITREVGSEKEPG